MEMDEIFMYFVFENEMGGYNKGDYSKRGVGGRLVH